MSPLNRGPLLGPRMPPVGMRPPPPRFGGRLPMPGMPPRMPPPPPMGPMFGPMRQRMMPPRPGPMRPGGPPPPPLFGPRGRGVPPLMPPIMGPRVMGPRGPIIRPGPRGLLPPQGLPHMRPRFPIGNGNVKIKAMINTKKVSKLEELELKKPWMTDEIRNEIQKKNKLYAKAKKNKDAKEWEEFKDLRNKVTRMIRDAKNEYMAKNPEQAIEYEDDDDEPYDRRDEYYTSSEEDSGSRYCEACDREFETAHLLWRHVETHRICSIDDCTFAAHPKLVEKHIKMQHCTGYYDKMKNISTPEDIQRWILDRKKKYPTKSNVERKRAEEIEKRERGEIIERQVSKKRPEKNSREKKKRTRRRRYQDSKFKEESRVEFYRGLLPFAGTANLRKDENEEETRDEDEEMREKSSDLWNFSDDDDIDSLRYSNEFSQSKTESSEVPVKMENQSGLASLIANYGTDSEDEAPEEIPIKKMKLENPLDNVPPQESSIKPVIIEQSPSSAVSNVPSEKQEISKPAKDKPKSKQNAVTSHNQKSKEKQPYNNKSCMLLQKLLARSIQHERNLICQCIKYIADNNFLDSPAKT